MTSRRWSTGSSVSFAASHLRKERQVTRCSQLRSFTKPTCGWWTRRTQTGRDGRISSVWLRDLMRQILVDHARRSKPASARCDRVSLARGGELSARTEPRPRSPRQWPHRRLRSSTRENARPLNSAISAGSPWMRSRKRWTVSPVTVRRDLRMAEAWLHHEMRNA